MTEEQLNLFEEFPLDMFYIYEIGDESKFPVVGFQNLDSNGYPYMDEIRLKLFAGDLLGLVVRSCADRKFDIAWSET